MLETFLKLLKEKIQLPKRLKFDRTFIHWAFNFLLFYIGWGFALTGALNGKPYQGPIIVFFFLIYHLFQIRFNLAEMIVIASVAVIGTVNDSIYLNLGLIEYKGGYQMFPYIAPLWVTSIWVLFGMCLDHSLSWMRGNPILASIIGGVGGAISYSAAARIGVATFHPNILSVAVIIGVVWAFFMPSIIWYSRAIDRLFQKQS